MHLKRDVWLLSRDSNVIMGDIDALMDAITIVISANTRNKGRHQCKNLFSASCLTCQVTPKGFQAEMRLARICVV